MGLIRDAIKGGIATASGSGTNNNSYNNQQSQWSQRYQFQQNPSQYNQPSPYQQSPYGGVQVPPSQYQADPYASQSTRMGPPVPPRPAGYSTRDNAPAYSQTVPANYPQQQQDLGGNFYSQQALPTSMASGPLQRPFAIPQIDASSSAPFLRGWSNELGNCGVDQRDYIQFIDALNVTVIPNPEMQLANKAAGLAGWFIPGMAAGIALTGIQVGAQIGGAVQTKGATKTCMQNANHNIFNPRGLEVQLQTTQQLNSLVGIYSPSSSNTQSSFDPSSRLQQFNGYIAPLSTVLPPLQGAGRQDALAQLGSSLSNRSQRKAQEKAQEDAMKGKMKKANKLETAFLWLVVTNAGSLGPQVVNGGGRSSLDVSGSRSGSTQLSNNFFRSTRGSQSRMGGHMDDFDDDGYVPSDRKY